MASASSQPALSYDVNWGPASSLDATVFGACRPGGPGGEERTPAGSISDAAVDAWAQYMRSAGITRVVSLLEAEELTAYATPLETQYARLFKRHDLVRMSHDPEGAAVARAALLAAFADAHACGERVVVHCRGGQSRTGLALATWMVAHHGLSAAQAAEEVKRGAEAAGVVRFTSAEKVAKFMGP